MMWKESYRLGIDRLDTQHMELFKMTDKLVHAVAANETRETFESIFSFLKDYAVEHFREEEAYQMSIQYPNLKAHKKEHDTFSKIIQNYEKKLNTNNFALGTLKDLTGMLTTWLIYHVASTDQKIVSDSPVKAPLPQTELLTTVLSESALEVLEKMAGLSPDHFKKCPAPDHKSQGDIFVEISLVGDLKGLAVFGFSKELALNLIRIMTSMELTELDEMVQSALCELTNISCGNATIRLTEKKISSDITTPTVKMEIPEDTRFTGVLIDTGMGKLDVFVLTDEAAN